MRLAVRFAPQMRPQQTGAVQVPLVSEAAIALTEPVVSTAARSRGTPMDDALRPVDLYRRPVALHGGDLAAGDAPQQTGAVQVIQQARWMTSEQGQRIPAEVGGTLSPANIRDGIKD